jgi:hypothetical protein
MGDSVNVNARARCVRYRCGIWRQTEGTRLRCMTAAMLGFIHVEVDPSGSNDRPSSDGSVQQSLAGEIMSHPS